MNLIDQWLSPYRTYLSVDDFLSEVEEEVVADEEVEDAGLFFENLLGPIDHFSSSTRYWSQYFAGAEDLNASPQEARETALGGLVGKETVGHTEACLLAEAYFLMGRYRPSEIATAVAYLVGGRTLGVVTLLAGMAIREGRLQEAELVLDMADELYPNHPAIAFCGATRSLAAEQVAAAEAALLALTEAHPLYRPSWPLLLDVLMLQQKWEEAVQQSEAATRLYPSDPAIWERLAQALRHVEDFPSALKAMDAAIQCTRDSVGTDRVLILRLHLEAARLQEETGRQDAALATYRGLLESGQTDAAIFVNAASCMQGLGKSDDAVEFLRKGLGIHPDNPNLLSSLGEILFAVGEDQEAFAALQTATETEPNRIANLFLMAVLCLRNQQFNQAIELATAVVQSDPTRSTEAFILIGDAHRFNGNAAAALEAYRAARQIAPDEAAIGARIAELEIILTRH